MWGGSNAFISRGTKGIVETTDNTTFVLTAQGKTLRIPYAKINLIEYGQNVSRRIVLAILISPMFLLAKAREHFVTLGYTDDQGNWVADFWSAGNSPDPAWVNSATFNPRWIDTSYDVAPFWSEGDYQDPAWTNGATFNPFKPLCAACCRSS